MIGTCQNLNSLDVDLFNSEIGGTRFHRVLKFFLRWEPIGSIFRRVLCRPNPFERTVAQSVAAIMAIVSDMYPVYEYIFIFRGSAWFVIHITNI